MAFSPILSFPAAHIDTKTKSNYAHLDGILNVDESHHIQGRRHLVCPVTDGVECAGGDGLRGETARAVTTVHTSLQTKHTSVQQQVRETQLGNAKAHTANQPYCNRMPMRTSQMTAMDVIVDCTRTT